MTLLGFLKNVVLYSPVYVLIKLENEFGFQSLFVSDFSLINKDY